MSYVAAKAAGFDSASVAEVEAVQDRMAQVWWHVGEMKPAYLCYLAHAVLPENSAQFPLWREIAAEVLPQMDEAQRAILVRRLPLQGPWPRRVSHAARPDLCAPRARFSPLSTQAAPLLVQRRCWHNYSKRLAKIAVGVSRWVKRLQEYAVQPAEGLVTNAHRSLEARLARAGGARCPHAASLQALHPPPRPGRRLLIVCCAHPQLMEITKHMADAVQEEYVAK
jgi:hypothetical protein